MLIASAASLAWEQLHILIAICFRKLVVAVRRGLNKLDAMVDSLQHHQLFMQAELSLTSVSNGR